MPDLVQNGELDLLDEVLPVGEIPLQRALEEGDAVRVERVVAVDAPLGQGGAVVETVELALPDAGAFEVGPVRLVLDDQRDVPDLLPELLRKTGERFPDEFLELLPGQNFFSICQRMRVMGALMARA